MDWSREGEEFFLELFFDRLMGRFLADQAVPPLINVFFADHAKKIKIEKIKIEKIMKMLKIIKRWFITIPFEIDKLLSFKNLH